MQRCKTALGVQCYSMGICICVKRLQAQTGRPVGLNQQGGLRPYDTRGRRDIFGPLLYSPGAKGAEESLGVGFFLLGAVAVERACVQRLQAMLARSLGAKPQWTRSLEGWGSTMTPLAHFNSGLERQVQWCLQVSSFWDHEVLKGVFGCLQGSKSATS